MVLPYGDLIKSDQGRTLHPTFAKETPFKDHEWQVIDAHGSKGKGAACSIVVELRHLNFPTLNPPEEQLECKETAQTNYHNGGSCIQMLRTQWKNQGSCTNVGVLEHFFSALSFMTIISF